MVVKMEFKDKTQHDRILRSRIQLLMKFPFYGTLTLSLEVIEDYSIPTAGVDGKRFYYNPDFIKTLSDSELNWVTAHEVMHCALGHIWRRGLRNHQKFNIACDYAIHCILIENKSDEFRMPKDCLYDTKFNNKSCEEIYDMLPEPPQIQQGQGQGGKGGESGEGDYPKTFDDHSKWDDTEVQEGSQNKQKDWQEKMMSAAAVAENKTQGSVPGSIKRLMGQIQKPQKDWRILLAEFIQFEVFDYGFMPPDRRYYGFSDLLLPDWNEETEKIQDMVFAIDTSGSIGDKEMVMFFSELIGMMQQFNNAVRGHIIYIDSEVAAVYDFEDVDDVLKAKPAGGGGTDMEEAIRFTTAKLESSEWDVAGICILTDGYTSYTMKENDIPFPVLWLVTNEEQDPTYGQVARMKI
jgi:predicted metal-dependent peptidase